MKLDTQGAKLEDRTMRIAFRGYPVKTQGGDVDE